jgi:hypothetical protein
VLPSWYRCFTRWYKSPECDLVEEIQPAVSRPTSRAERREVTRAAYAPPPALPRSLDLLNCLPRFNERGDLYLGSGRWPQIWPPRKALGGPMPTSIWS